MMRPDNAVRVYLCVTPVDMRKSINGLSILVEQALGLDFSDPAMFVFMGKRPDRIKLLYWEKNGFCLWYKRLEEGKFCWPRLSDDATKTVMMTGEELNWLLDGFDVWRHPPHRKMLNRRVA